MSPLQVEALHTSPNCSEAESATHPQHGDTTQDNTKIHIRSRSSLPCDTRDDQCRSMPSSRSLSSPTRVFDCIAWLLFFSAEGHLSPPYPRSRPCHPPTTCPCAALAAQCRVLSSFNTPLTLHPSQPPSNTNACTLASTIVTLTYVPPSPRTRQAAVQTASMSRCRG